MSVDPDTASFTDTNILVYALAEDDPVRSPIAQQLLRALMGNNTLRTSTQVLQELYSTLTRKVTKKLTSEQAIRYLDRIATFPVSTTDYSAIRDAAQLSEAHTLSFWDALIIIAAARARASRLYTEDLQHGRTILGIEIVNPFLEARPL